MTASRALALLLVGVLGGVLSGLFGVGGGIIMVPLLTVLAGMDQRGASATSLIAILPTSIVGTISYGVAGHLDVIAGLLIAVGGIGGSLLGARLLRTLPLAWLRWLFVAFLVFAAIRLFFAGPTHGSGIDYTWQSVLGLVALGVVMGISSGLFGIGGGAVVIPALVTLFGTAELLAKGTSLLAMIPASATGTIANARAHLVTIFDGLLVGIPAALASLVGTAIAFVLPSRTSTILFAILILLAVAQIIYRALRDGKATDTSGDGAVHPARTET